MASGVQSQSLLHDLFAPLPEEPSSAPPPKDGLDRVAQYMESTSGAWDLFRIFDHAVQYLQNLPSLSEGFKDLSSGISKVVSLSGVSLSLPTLFSDVNTLRRKTGAFVSALELPHSDPLRRQKVLQSGKDAFVSSMWLTNTAAQATLFFNEAKLVKLGEYLPVVDGVYQGSALVSDGIEMVEQAYNLHSYQKVQPRDDQEAAELGEKKWLAWMVVLKDVASVALSIISLVGIALGIAIFSLPVMAVVALGLSTTWLTMKISSYFYKEIIKERRDERALNRVLV